MCHSKTAQDASLTLSRTSLGFTLLLLGVRPVVTEAMICQSVVISSSGHVSFVFSVKLKELERTFYSGMVWHMLVRAHTCFTHWRHWIIQGTVLLLRASRWSTVLIPIRLWMLKLFLNSRVCVHLSDISQHETNWFIALNKPSATKSLWITKDTPEYSVK